MTYIEIIFLILLAVIAWSIKDVEKRILKELWKIQDKLDETFPDRDFY